MILESTSGREVFVVRYAEETNGRLYILGIYSTRTIAMNKAKKLRRRFESIGVMVGVEVSAHFIDDSPAFNTWGL